jgi:hypothetical protein
MTADATVLQGVVNIRQDGNLYVPTGKSANVESGGVLTVETGGQFAMPTEAGSSAATFANYGLTTFGATAATACLLAAPNRAGLIKVIACTVHGATTVSNTVTTVAAKILGGSTVVGGTSVITFTSNAGIALISASTTEWILMSQPAANIAFS